MNQRNTGSNRTIVKIPRRKNHKTFKRNLINQLAFERFTANQRKRIELF